MRRCMREASVWLAWLGVIGCAFAGAGNIDVYVYNLQTGAEVRNYTARLVGTGGYDQSITVGDTNYVRFSNVPTTQLYTLTVSKDGYYSRSIYRIIVSHARTRGFNLALTPTGVSNRFSISGRVVDAVTNQPIANAYVTGYRSVSSGTRDVCTPSPIPRGVSPSRTASRVAMSSGRRAKAITSRQRWKSPRTARSTTPCCPAPRTERLWAVG